MSIAQGLASLPCRVYPWLVATTTKTFTLLLNKAQHDSGHGTGAWADSEII